eukprot:m.460581 g.460581  ORF g.460581 m.460581 type:complete len:65 (-) comp21596_c0_seq13:892-1086(-)
MTCLLPRRCIDDIVRYSNVDLDQASTEYINRTYVECQSSICDVDDGSKRSTIVAQYCSPKNRFC